MKNPENTENGEHVVIFHDCPGMARLVEATVYHEWANEAAGKRYIAILDDGYAVERACGRSVTEPCNREMHGSEPEADCDRFANEEYEKLESGEWIALGVVVEARCEGLVSAGCEGVDCSHPKLHCPCCSQWRETDETCWGIVIESGTEAIEKFVADEGGL